MEHAETLAGPSGADPREVRLRPEHTCLWTHTTKRVSLVFHVDDLLLPGTHQIIKEVLTELSRDLELKSSEVTTQPTRYLGRTLVTTSVLMLRMWKARWRGSSCPRSRVHQHCDGNAVRMMRRGCPQANKRSTDSMLENCCGLTELACVARWRKPHRASDMRATRT